MINNMEYIQSAALVKVQEKKLLNKSKINRMIESNTALDILKILNETDYSKSMVGITKEEEYEEILRSELKRTYDFARELVKDRIDILEVLDLKNTFQELKQNLKYEVKDAKILEIDSKYMPYYKKALAEYEKTNDIQRAVILLDKLYFEKLNSLCKNINIEIFNKYFKLNFDMYNLITFLRLKNQKRSYKYAEFCILDENLLKIYENDSNYMQSLEKYYDNKKMWDKFSKTSKISTLEKELENSILNLMKEYSNVNYGIEPVITYIIAKEYEIKAIRLIMTAKINKISTEIIKERLRETYV